MQTIFRGLGDYREKQEQTVELRIMFNVHYFGFVFADERD